MSDSRGPCDTGGVGVVDLTPTAVVPSHGFRELIPSSFAREHLILSMGEAGGAERLLIADSTDPSAVYNTGVRLGKPVESTTIDPEALARLIDEVLGIEESETEVAESAGSAPSVDQLLADTDRNLLATSGKAPVVKLVDAILFESLGRGASDVHIQPLADRTLVRYRVDGVLHIARELDRELTQAIVSRIKVMGKMDIAERLIPQDGRAAVMLGSGGRSVDLRISTLPTSYGERAVIRLLDSAGARALRTFEDLGMPRDVRSAFIERATRTSGIVLVTGPTGSGKTTTLYTTLRCLAGGEESGRESGEVNVMTIEDPIEFELSTSGVAISQAQVNSKKGVSFATGLRSILRQDPDVVMVGEIRDAETARIAIQASLTGHLVLSTLHTNDAPSAVTRLGDLGIEPYLVSASLSAVLAQRLARRLHADCRGVGCEGCFGSGFQGRVGVYELLVISERIRSLITSGATAAELRAAGVRDGMRTLRDHGSDIVREGVTTQQEIERVALGGLDDAESVSALIGEVE